MRLRRWPAALGLLLVFLAAGACSGGPPEDPAVVEGRPAGTEGPFLGWTRHDLAKHLPRFDSEHGEARSRLHLLGQGALLKRRPVSRNRSATRPRRLAGEVRALEAPAGRDLRWTVDLGAEPFLSYRPLAASEPGCRRRYRVRAAGPDGVFRDVHRHPAAEASFFAPALVEVPLEDFAGGRVEIVLRLDAEGDGCASADALWGSPAVYSRHPVAVRPGRPERPNIVLLGLDTVRADALGTYRPAAAADTPTPTPAIDRLARESDVWLEAFSSFNVTNPSFASILTGLHGKNHGVYDLRTPLPEDRVTLAETLAAAGYDTAAVISARHLGSRQSGLGRGFDAFLVPPTRKAAELAVDEAMDWISKRRRPFFLWLHLFDPHTPHTPPMPYASGYRPGVPGLGPVVDWHPFRAPGEVEYDHPVLGGHRDLYASETAYLDRHVGRLLAFLASRGLDDRTVIALVSDHGENLGEHGILYRHSGLWDTTTHVPLMVRWPGRKRQGRRLTGLVQTLDLFPTLLAAAGLEPPPGDGVDLRDLEGGRPRVFAEASDRQGAMVRTATHLLFWAFEDRAGRIESGPHFHDLRRDPAQETNLAGSGLAEEIELRKTLRRWLDDRRSGDRPPAVPLTEEQLEQMRALGYAGL